MDYSNGLKKQTDFPEASFDPFLSESVAVTERHTLIRSFPHSLLSSGGSVRRPAAAGVVVRQEHLTTARGLNNIPACLTLLLPGWVGLDKTRHGEWRSIFIEHGQVDMPGINDRMGRQRTWCSETVIGQSQIGDGVWLGQTRINRNAEG